MLPSELSFDLGSRNSIKRTSNQRDSDIDGIVTPALEASVRLAWVPKWPRGGELCATHVHDSAAVGDEDLDEHALEELRTVEEEIGGHPASGGSEKAASKVRKRELERGGVVAGDSSLALGRPELAIRRVIGLVVTVVGKPEGHDGDDGELNAERPLGREGGIRLRISSMEDEEEDDEDNLVEHLSPSLHEECKDDIAAAVETVVRHGLRRHVGLGLEGGGRRHRVLSSDTNSVNEEAPGVCGKV
jgi:hypothetical protein